MGCGKAVSNGVIKTFTELLADGKSLHLAIAVIKLVGIGAIAKNAQGAVGAHQWAEQCLTSGCGWWGQWVSDLAKGAAHGAVVVLEELGVDLDWFADWAVVAWVGGENGDLEPGALQIAIEHSPAAGKGHAGAVVPMDDGDAYAFPGLKTTQIGIHLQPGHNWGGIADCISKGQSGQGGMDWAQSPHSRNGA